MNFSDSIKIECCYPELYQLICLAFPEGATINDVLLALQLEPNNYICSIWSKKCQLTTTLNNGDRVEINHPISKKLSCY